MKDSPKKTLSHVINEVIRLNALQKRGEIAPDQLAVLVKHFDPYLSEHIMETRELLSTLSSINEKNLLLPERSTVKAPEKRKLETPTEVMLRESQEFTNSLSADYEIPYSSQPLKIKNSLVCASGAPTKYFNNLSQIDNRVFNLGGRFRTSATKTVDYHIVMPLASCTEKWRPFGQVVMMHLYYLSKNQSNVKFITEEHLFNELRRLDANNVQNVNFR